MSISDIKARFSKRIQTSAEENFNGQMKNQKPPKKNRQGPRQFLKETDIGIVRFISDLPGFGAVIKQRYSDFAVHEIDTEKNVIILNNFDAPDETAPKAGDVEGLLSTDVLADLEILVEKNSIAPNVEIDVTACTKEQRTDIHRFLKEKYGPVISANTFDRDTKKFISVSRYQSKKDDRWPGHLPCYLHFTLFKKNLDTNYACGVLAKKLNVKVDGFATAGTKDKRAITTQRVSVKYMRAHRLIAMKDLRSMAVGNFEYKSQALALGALWGNNFEIALREVTASDEDIEKSMTALKEHGFVNYYGMQRFGVAIESPTHLIGKLLIKEQYGPALDLVLKPRAEDQPDIRQAREVFARTRNAKAAWSCIKYKRGVEAQLLHGLSVNGPKAYVNAFDSIPRNVRLLYIHSYQSYIWNKVVTGRLGKHGNAVLVGDLVSPKEVTEDESELVGGEESMEDKESDHKLIQKTKPKPIILTAENVADYTIYDVLLPLPGTEALYPDNDTHQLYKDALAEDGLTTESFSSKSTKYNLTGSYRYIARIPKNLSWRTVRYAEDDQDLILSDEDKLEGKTLPEVTGDKKALVIRMDLGKSTYATMALREVLRCDTSAGHQANITLKRQAKDAEEAQSAKRSKDGDEDEDNWDVLRPEDY